LIHYARASSIILISWNVIFIWETGYWTRAKKRFALFNLLKSLYSDTKILSKYIPSLQKRLFINVWRKSVFDIYFTEFGAALTTVLHVLFKYCYNHCYSDSQKAVMKGGGVCLAL
jgi:hypothetical protein